MAEFPILTARLARLREYFATDTGTLIPVDICELDSHLLDSPRVYLAADVEAALASPQADQTPMLAHLNCGGQVEIALRMCSLAGSTLVER